MVRLAAFPVIFGASLLVFVVGFYNRRKLFPEIEEIHQKKAIESHYQAIAFKSNLAEAVRKEQERKTTSR